MSCAKRRARGRGRQAQRARHDPRVFRADVPAARRARGGGCGAARGAHRVGHVGLLGGGHERDGGVRLRRQHVHQRVGVPVQRHTCAWLEQLAVQRAQDAHVVVAAGGAAHDPGVGVHHLQELADDQRHRLNTLYLLLRAQQLALQVLLLVLDVLLLDVQELDVALQQLQAREQVRLSGVRLLRGAVRARRACAVDGHRVAAGGRSAALRHRGGAGAQTRARRVRGAGAHATPKRGLERRGRACDTWHKQCVAAAACARRGAWWTTRRRAATQAAQRSAEAHGALCSCRIGLRRGNAPAESSEAGVWCHSSVGRPAASAEGCGGAPSPSRARQARSGGRQRAAAGARSQASGERCALSSGPASCRSRAARSNGPPAAWRRAGSGPQKWRKRTPPAAAQRAPVRRMRTQHAAYAPQLQSRSMRRWQRGAAARARRGAQRTHSVGQMER